MITAHLEDLTWSACRHQFRTIYPDFAGTRTNHLLKREIGIC